MEGLAIHADGNEEIPFYHESVLLDEVIGHLAPAEGKFFIDGTLGGGGHAEALLRGNATVKGIDRDAQARAYASERLKEFGDRFEAVAGRFGEIARLASENGWPKADGILLDIGVSSWQIDAAERGFSFRFDGPLDMRMGESELTAADIVNQWGEDELAKIFREFGEEKSAWRITQWIIEARALKPFETTLQLADGIENLLGRRGRIHPATKVFQALRMAVNDELGELARFLESAADLLKPGGRLGIITFHSLEDRMVKQHFRDASRIEIDRPEWPAPRPNPDYRYQLLTRKGVAPGGVEIERNARSRSSRLRVVERI
jgi:16S rRNA (cytosine1402-N4)-methyltransferase